MVLQLAYPSHELPSFYGFLMNEKPDPKKHDQKILRSEDLFGAEKLVLIRHEDAVYRLMITRQGKLILNK